MPRLLRPAIPVEVKCRVVLRQLGELWPDQVLKENARGLGKMLDFFLPQLAQLLGCNEVSELRLDHDPALALRKKSFRKGVHVDYRPAANDPEFLKYRPHGTQYAGSHDVKTRIRGERGQFSDIALIKRERRRQKKAEPVKRGVGFKRKSKVSRAKIKRKWPSRPLKSASRWPKRKLNRRTP